MSVAQRVEEASDFKATCFKCFYQGDTHESICPSCGFPLIVGLERHPRGASRIESIINRTSVGSGAPPLPGVDSKPRQAQLRAEERRRRLAMVRAREEILEKAEARQARIDAIKVGLVCFSAVAAGVLAAVINRGW